MSVWNLLALALAGLVMWVILIFVAITGIDAFNDLEQRRPSAPVCNVVEIDCEP